MLGSIRFFKMLDSLETFFHEKQPVTPSIICFLSAVLYCTDLRYRSRNRNWKKAEYRYTTFILYTVCCGDFMFLWVGISFSFSKWNFKE